MPQDRGSGSEAAKWGRESGKRLGFALGGTTVSLVAAERAARGLTWRAVAAQSGVGASAALTRLRAGGRITFPEVMHALAWLGAPAARFVRAGGEGRVRETASQLPDAP